VDEESLLSNKPLLDSLTHIRVAGIHVFLRSQVLSHTALAAVFGAVFSLAIRCREIFGRNLQFINFGGGVGIPSSEDSPGVDLDILRSEVRRLVEKYVPSLPNCALWMESGRFLVGKAGVFISRIEDIKESRGITYVIVAAGMNGFFRPAMMNLLNALPFPVQGPFEPLFSNGAAHRVFLPEKNGGTLQRVTVCGNLCTSLDVLAQDILLPDPRTGDVLMVSNAGAYAASLSPFSFASFPRPAELYMDCEGHVAAL
jgi:diaminopimelate decarboxylase